MQVGSTSTHGSEQSASTGGDALAGHSSESGLSTPVRTPATADVQTHALTGLEAVVAALPVGAMLPPCGPQATPVPVIDVDACATCSMPDACGGAPAGTGEISLSPSPARHRIAHAAEAQAAADDAASGCAAAIAAAAAAVTSPPRAPSPAVPITLRQPSAASPADEGPELSGSPVSVAYALAARAGLPTALARPLTAAAGQAFGKVVSPAASSPLATGERSPQYGPHRASPPSPAHPMFLAFASQPDIASPLQSSTGALMVEPALKASASCSEADVGEHELLMLDASASAGACELSLPTSPAGDISDVAAAAAAAAGFQPKARAAPPPVLHHRKAQEISALSPAGRRPLAAHSGSVEGSDSASFGRDFTVSPSTLAAVSGVTDEQDALA